MTALLKSKRAAWLAERRNGVGASEVAAILGVDPRRGALSVYADKVAGKDSEDDSSWLAFGRDVEGAIAKAYARTTGREIIDLDPHEIVRHPDLPILGATPDRRVIGSNAYPSPVPDEHGVLELKAVGFHAKHQWSAEPPLQYVIQVQVQMACMKLRWGSIGALMGGIQIAEPVDLTPDAEFMAAVLEAVERFWWHVTTRTPPDADGLPSTRDAIRRIWSQDNGEQLILPDEGLTVVKEWAEAKEKKAQSDIQYEMATNKLAVLMGPAQEGAMPDGLSLMMKTEHRNATQCKVCGTQNRKAYSFRAPKIVKTRSLLTEGEE